MSIRARSVILRGMPSLIRRFEQKPVTGFPERSQSGGPLRGVWVGSSLCLVYLLHVCCFVVVLCFVGLIVAVCVFVVFKGYGSAPGRRSPSSRGAGGEG